MTFIGEYRGEVHPHEEKGVSPLTTPLLVLAVPSVLAGWLGFGENWTTALQGAPKAAEAPFGWFVHSPYVHAEAVDFLVMAITIAMAVVGFYFAWQMYGTRTMKLNETIAAKFPGAYNFSFNRWYWDDVYHGLAAFFIELFRAVWWFIDQFIVDSFVNLTSKVTRAAGEAMRYSENGRGQFYAMVIFGCVAVISVFIFFTRP